MRSFDEFNRLGAGKFPGHLGIVITANKQNKIVAEMKVSSQHMAPNGFLHAGALVSLADTCAGFGAMANLPEAATGFTTIELKTNHLGTMNTGVAECTASALHLGKSTQVWDANVVDQASQKLLATFRCTQMVLYNKNN